jgi:molybdopterin converting factor small subunit
MNDLGMDKSYAEERVKFAPCIVAEGLKHDVVETIAHKLQALGVSVSINSYAVTNMSNSQSVNQEQAVNQFEPDTEKSGKLGCWSKILYAIGVLIFLGYLAEKCGGDDTNVDEGNASQATEQVVSDEGQEETDKVAKAGYDDGYNCAFTNSEDMEYHEGENEESVRTSYYIKGFNTKNDKYYKIYRENFWKGYKDGVKAR